MHFSLFSRLATCAAVISIILVSNTAAIARDRNVRGPKATDKTEQPTKPMRPGSKFRFPCNAPCYDQPKDDAYRRHADNERARAKDKADAAETAKKRKAEDTAKAAEDAKQKRSKQPKPEIKKAADEDAAGLQKVTRADEDAATKAASDAREKKYKEIEKEARKVEDPDADPDDDIDTEPEQIKGPDEIKKDQEEAAKKKAAEDAAKKKAEDDAKQKAAEEAQRKAAAEAEAKRKAEEARCAWTGKGKVKTRPADCKK